MRIIKLAAAGIAAGALLLTGTSAYAAGGATLKASSATVYQGGKLYLSARCPNAADHPLLASRLFVGGRAHFGVAGRTTFVQVNVSKTKKPGKYPILLGCVSMGHFDAIATTDVTVLKATRSTSRSAISRSGGKPFGVASVIIDTGFGGMARFVAHHHPAA